HQVVCSVEGKTCVNTDDTTTRVCIRKSSYSVGVTGTADIRCVSTEDTIVYSCHVLCENFMNSWVWFITVFFKSCFCHADTAFRHEVQFEQLVVLNTVNQLIFF